MVGRFVIVGFVSQKGGTGKSTLARALGAVVAVAGLQVKIADLDPPQGTVLEWERIREENSTSPTITVEAFDTAAEAIASAEEDELLIIDAPAGANRGTLEIAQAATLIVQRMLNECSVWTPHEIPDALIHQAGVRAHWIVTSVFDPYNG